MSAGDRNGNQQDTWKELATQLRADSIRATTAAGSGHPTSSMSAADLMAVLLASHLRIDLGEPRAPRNDRLIFSKGHAAPLLYAVLKAAGAISDAELMSLRKRGSPIQGHPSPVLPFVEVATGSLGQGLAAAVGMALAGKRLGGTDARFWVLLGDSEMAEGSVYESMEAASFYGLDRVVAILDMNRLGQRGQTMLGWDGEAYAARARGFGWEAAVIDGHDLSAIHAAYQAAARASRPTLIVARTKKGAGVSFLADHEGWHGKALSPDEAKRALAELGVGDRVPARVVKPAPAAPAKPAADRPSGKLELPSYEPGTEVATRAAFGDALAAVGAANPRLVVLDGEVSNSTYTDRFAKAHPERFFQMYIAEQQLVSAAVGMQVLGWTPFASTFAAFLTRAFDQIRMAAISGATLNLNGSHAGVSIGEDGPSQMALEDLAMMRAVHGSVVLYPSCANATAKLTAEMAGRRGIQYLRSTREKTPVLYPPGEPFPIGGSKVLRRSKADRVALVAAGITLHEALKAHDRLRGEGVAVRVIDLYSVKPVDRATLQEAARDCAGGLIVVEDHHPEGGLGDAVAECFDGAAAPAIRRLAVRIMPGSSSPQEELQDAGIDADAIARAVRESLT
ncbi:MAG TPA: transketolase [Polyangia bacterium]|nr:transketolase [Polyangia bacterium]